MSHHLDACAAIEDGIHAIVGCSHLTLARHQTEQRAVLTPGKFLRSHNIDGKAIDELRYAVSAMCPVVAAIVLRYVATHIECGYACLGESRMRAGVCRQTIAARG